MAALVHRPPRRPKKRPRTVQKKLDGCSISLCGSMDKVYVTYSFQWDYVPGVVIAPIKLHVSGRVSGEDCISSREAAAKCMEKVLKRRVMVSSARQVVSGFLAAGAINATMYLSHKMRKAWYSRS